jgi:hypothetical protein
MDMDERLRRARFYAAAKARTIVDLQVAIKNMETTASDLRQFIDTEERRTKITDRSRVTYSLAANHAADRAHRLQKTIVELASRLRIAIIERDSTVAQISIWEETSATKQSPTPARAVSGTLATLPPPPSALVRSA